MDWEEITSKQSHPPLGLCSKGVSSEIYNKYATVIHCNIFHKNMRKNEILSNKKLLIVKIKIVKNLFYIHIET